MDGRAWAGLLAGITGAAGGAAVGIGGQPTLGAVVGAACLLCALVVVLVSRRVATRTAAAIMQARLEELDSGARAAAAELAAAAATRRQMESESVLDGDSGLWDHRVFNVTFESKVAAARRHLRPLSLVLIDIGPSLPPDAESRRQALSGWGAVVAQTLRESDVSCRVGDTTFGIILEDTPETGGVWAAERLQIAASCSAMLDPAPISAAVAAYPNHGLRPDALLAQAWAALERARGRSDGMGRFGRVEVPSAEQ
jgi:GGDEF domain-containing protein